MRAGLNGDAGVSPSWQHDILGQVVCSAAWPFILFLFKKIGFTDFFFLVSKAICVYCGKFKKYWLDTQKGKEVLGNSSILRHLFLTFGLSPSIQYIDFFLIQKKHVNISQHFPNLASFDDCLSLPFHILP